MIWLFVVAVLASVVLMDRVSLAHRRALSRREFSAAMLELTRQAQILADAIGRDVNVALADLVDALRAMGRKIEAPR